MKSWGAARRVTFLLSLASVSAAACGWNPSRPFDRDAPAVREAIAQLDAGAASAASKLEDYLSTGACKEGNIGTPDVLKRRADGTFDLGLALFKLGEHFGRRFGEEEGAPGEHGRSDENVHARRHEQIQCALRLLRSISDEGSLAPSLRAWAHTLEGNLQFLDGEYEDAVKAYDQALGLLPAEADAGDAVSRDAAWNRAIALQRIEDKKKDGGSDASQDAPSDGPSEGGGDSGRGDSGDDRSKDAGHDSASPSPPDAGSDGGDAAPPPSEPPDSGEPPREAAAPPPPKASEDERMLDQLENAPTLQQEEAKRMGHKRVRGMADK